MKIMEEPIIFRVDGSRLPNSSPTRRLSAPADTPNTEYCCSNFVDIAHPSLSPKSSTLCWDFPLQTIQLYKLPWLVPEISQPCLTGGPNPEVQDVQGPNRRHWSCDPLGPRSFPMKYGGLFQPRCPENWYFKGWSLHESSNLVYVCPSFPFQFTFTLGQILGPSRTTSNAEIWAIYHSTWFQQVPKFNKRPKALQSFNTYPKAWPSLRAIIPCHFWILHSNHPNKHIYIYKYKHI